MSVYRAERFHDPQGLLTVVMVCLGVELSQALFGLLDNVLVASNSVYNHGYSISVLLTQWLTPGSISYLIGGREIFLFVAFTFFLKLVARLNHNAWFFGAAGMEYTPFWSVCWWFIPIVYLRFSFEALQEIWRVSQSGSGPWKSHAGNQLVALWWAHSVLFTMLVLMRGLEVFGATSAPESAIRLELGIDFVSIILNILSIFALKQIVHAQLNKFDSGERYDRPTETCSGCGEPITLRLGHCPVCGKSLEIETLEPA